MHALVRGVAAVGAAGLGALAYASLVERDAFVLRRFEVPVLPVGAAPVTLLHLSDLHLTPGQRRKADWVRGLAGLRPDLVVVTGDHIAHPDSLDLLLEAYEPFLRLPGAFVLGSNDYYAPAMRNPFQYFDKDREIRPTTSRLPTERLVLALGERGWRDLTNARGRLEVGGLGVELVGVDDPHIERDRYDLVAGPADPAADLTLGVAHAPYTRVLDAMTADGARLVLAGHTHGGQVAVPGRGALVTNCDLDTGRVKGLSRWWPGAADSDPAAAPADAAWLHVSAGLGTSPYAPVRFSCRPEASLLTLVPARA